MRSILRFLRLSNIHEHKAAYVNKSHAEVYPKPRGVRGAQLILEDSKHQNITR